MEPSVFRHTPSVTVRDPRGLTVRNIQYHRHPDAPAITDTRITRHDYDIRGLLSHRTDPRLYDLMQTDSTVSPNFVYQSALSGTVLRTGSTDAGTTVVLNDAVGRPALAVSATDTVRTWLYEGASLPGRPLSVTEQGPGGAPRITEHFVYAGSSVAEQSLNLVGQCVRHYDPAGRVQLNSLSLSGTVLSQSRQLLPDEQDADWQGADETAWGSELTGGGHVTQCTMNATGEALTQTDAAGNMQRMAYDVAGQLSGTWLKVKGGTEQVIVKSLTYSAAGQTLREEHGNGVVTTWTYEPQTQRLTGIKTERPAGHPGGAKVLQDLRYEYDPAGNVLKVSHDTEAPRFWRNQKVVPESTYVYDSLYQLVSATGREMANAGLVGSGQAPAAAILPVDGSTFTNYTRTYTYDRGGNLTRIQHSSPAAGNSHATNMTVSDRSNRAVVSSLTADPAQVDTLFTGGGQQMQLLPGQQLSWTARNELAQVTPVMRPGQASDRETYRYDSQSRRVSKTTVQQTGSSVQTQRVMYLPGLELRTTLSGSTVTESLQVIGPGEAGRAGVRVLQWESGKPDAISNNQVRYSYGDLIQSAGLEVDGDGYIISQEEYYPYGGTAVLTARNQTEVKYKTLCYSGKERDATGLYYYGYRYYQPWAGRWLSADPVGTVDGLNLFRMVRSNPITHSDRDGKMTEEEKNLYLHPSEEDISLFHHPQIPSSINIDPDGIDMLLQSERGNAFVGVMNLESGDIFLNPVLRRPSEDGHTIWTGSDFKGVAKIRNVPVEAIEHNNGNGPAHLQLIERLNNNILKSVNTKYPSQWIGFGIRSRESLQRALHLTARSYSLNAERFLYWIRGNKDAAFEQYHTEKLSTARSQLSLKLMTQFVSAGMDSYDAWINGENLAEDEIQSVSSAPEWGQVIGKQPRTEGGVSGELPDYFSKVLLREFNKKLVGRINVYEGL